VHVDGQSFAPIGVHETDAASDWLHCMAEQRRQRPIFAKFAISFGFAAMRTLRAELTMPLDSVLIVGLLKDDNR
jgi:hypothetical protein